MSEVLSALGIVLATIAVLRLALQPYLIRSRGSKRRLRVLESCALGPRQRMHIIECDGERILVGATDGAINVIRELEPAADPSPAHETSPVALLSRLRQALGGRLLIPVVALLLAGPAVAAEGPTSDLLSTLSDIESAAAPDRLSNTIEIVLLMTLITIAPSLLLMTTCFTRVVIVLSLLRQAIGIQQLPPNQVIIGLALFVTFFVMAPVGEAIQQNSVNPYIEREIDASIAKERALVPIRAFLLNHTRERDLSLFVSLAGEGEAEVNLEEVPLKVLLPSYMISELRTAFEIGFTVFLPFLVIDLVIASILISMGMIVLPPIVISLPFKLMLFVLLDGWNLVIGTLVRDSSREAPMNLDQISELVQGVVFTALLVSTPVLLGATALGLLISIFQAATQINEQTLTFVPKIFVVLITFALLFPWMMRTILDFSTNAITSGVSRGNFP